MEFSEIKIEYSCRICLQTCENLESLFAGDSTAGEIAEIIITLFTVSVIENDGLSKKICSTCKLNVIQAYQLQQLCIASDTTVRLWLKNEMIRTMKLEIDDNEPGVYVGGIGMQCAACFNIIVY